MHAYGDKFISAIHVSRLLWHKSWWNPPACLMIVWGSKSPSMDSTTYELQGNLFVIHTRDQVSDLTVSQILSLYALNTLTIFRHTQVSQIHFQVRTASCLWSYLYSTTPRGLANDRTKLWVGLLGIGKMKHRLWKYMEYVGINIIIRIPHSLTRWSARTIVNIGHKYDPSTRI